MKTVIAGSRSIGRLSPRKWDYEMLVALIEKAVQDSQIQITEVISGGAGGPDRAGEKWAESKSIPVTQIKPNWKLGRGAGLIANKELVEHAEALVVDSRRATTVFRHPHPFLLLRCHFTYRYLVFSHRFLAARITPHGKQENEAANAAWRLPHGVSKRSIGNLVGGVLPRKN